MFLGSYAFYVARVSSFASNLFYVLSNMLLPCESSTQVLDFIKNNFELHNKMYNRDNIYNPIRLCCMLIIRYLKGSRNVVTLSVTSYLRYFLRNLFKFRKISFVFIM